MRLAIGIASAIASAIYYGNALQHIESTKQLLSIFNNYYYQHVKCTSAHWIYQAIIIIF